MLSRGSLDSDLRLDSSEVFRMHKSDGTIWNWSEIVRQARETRARADRARSDARAIALNDAAARRKQRREVALEFPTPPRLSLVRRRGTDQR